MPPKVQRLSLADRSLLFRLLAKLISADTTNPPGDESRVADVIQLFLKQQGIKFQICGQKKGRTNLLFFLGRGSPRIFVPAHADTVPAGDGWRTDPFELVKKGQRIIGRGVVDNKGPLAALLITAKLLKKFEAKLNGQIIFGAIADEERGNHFGIDYLLARKIIQPDYAIVPDSCGRNQEIGIAEKGVLHLQVSAFGRQGHGSMPESGLNAFYILSDFLALARKLKFQKRDSLLGGVTLNVGSVQAGVAANLIPGTAVALLDIRYPPHHSLRKEILKCLEKIADIVAKKWRAKKFKMEKLVDFPPSATAKDHRLVSTALAASRTVIDKTVGIAGLPVFTLAGALRAVGIPTISCGPGDLTECHRANESLPAKELVEFTEVMLELLKRLTVKAL